MIYTHKLEEQGVLVLDVQDRASICCSPMAADGKAQVPAVTVRGFFVQASWH